MTLNYGYCDFNIENLTIQVYYYKKINLNWLNLLILFIVFELILITCCDENRKSAKVSRQNCERKGHMIV